MKLSKIYCNKPDLFEAIVFGPELNVVMAEIRLPENKNKDTHNLGKTTLGKLIDFCLLLGRDPTFFLFKHEVLFSSFTFFLELQLLDDSYLTIRRSVSEASKISFKKHKGANLDLAAAQDSNWDHLNVPFERSKDLLDGLLNLTGLNPWHFRKGLGYLLRSQDDYRDVFQLKRFAAVHADWKPFLAHILGFQHSLISEHYEKEADLAEVEKKIDLIRSEFGIQNTDPSKIDGLLLLKKTEAEKKQKELDAFDFRLEDKKETKALVDSVNEQIADLNTQRYSLSQNLKKIASSLQEGQIQFEPEQARLLFEEVGVNFGGQIKKDFDQLIAFNKAITEERRMYLEEEKLEIQTELKRINKELNALNKTQSDRLSYLSDTDIFRKYKTLSSQLVTLRADITSLERQKEAIERLDKLRSDERELGSAKNKLQILIEENVKQQNADEESLFSKIRLFFSEIVEAVLDRKALLSASTNKLGHLEFRAEILDEAGNATSAGLGNTYRKLLCIAFDLAVLRAHLGVSFPRFVYHDGVFEALDDRKKKNLLDVIRSYNDLGIQHLITLIDSDLPSTGQGRASIFDQSEIVLHLHDEGESGRLFKMKSW